MRGEDGLVLPKLEQVGGGPIILIQDSGWLPFRSRYRHVEDGAGPEVFTVVPTNGGFRSPATHDWKQRVLFY